MLAEMKGFNYQKTLKALLGTYKGNAKKKEFAPVYLTSTTKSVKHF